jgi:hypothetical protein
MKRSTLLLILLGAAGMAEAATTIYRCGPGGREYSQRPCPEGTVVEGTDGRTAAQRAAAVRVEAQEKRKLAEMERERLANESKNKSAPAAEINGLARPWDAAASAPERDGAKKKSAKGKDGKDGKDDKGAKAPKDFVAIEPVVKKK